MKLADFNQLPLHQAAQKLHDCCGSSKWVQLMLNQLPFASIDQIHQLASDYWNRDCEQSDWLEAFDHHPKIGDLKNLEKKFASTQDWSGEEQAAVHAANREVLQALAAGNTAYEQKFGYIFIVCATGKSASEMLALLQARLDNRPKKEIRIAQQEQEKITQLRLKKLLEI